MRAVYQNIIRRHPRFQRGFIVLWCALAAMTLLLTSACVSQTSQSSANNPVVLAAGSSQSNGLEWHAVGNTSFQLAIQQLAVDGRDVNVRYVLKNTSNGKVSVKLAGLPEGKMADGSTVIGHPDGPNTVRFDLTEAVSHFRSITFPGWVIYDESANGVAATAILPEQGESTKLLISGYPFVLKRGQMQAYGGYNGSVGTSTLITITIAPDGKDSTMLVPDTSGSPHQRFAIVNSMDRRYPISGGGVIFARGKNGGMMFRDASIDIPVDSITTGDSLTFHFPDLGRLTGQLTVKLSVVR